MDVVEVTDEFQDWELLQTNSDSEPAPVTSADSGNSFDELDSGGLIQVNYFSSDPIDRYEEGVDDGKSVGSDNPGWIEPGFGEGPARRPNWPDSSSDRSEDQKFSELEGIYELGFRGKEEKDAKAEAIEEKGEEAGDLGDYCMESGAIDGDSAEIGNPTEDSQAESQVAGEEMNGSEGIGGGVEAVDREGGKSRGEVERMGVVWWKMPMEFLKYCMMRMSPVWTVSVAAAFMGFVILGRRLYKMKKKTRGLQIKVAVDDKVSVLSCYGLPCIAFVSMFRFRFNSVSYDCFKATLEVGVSSFVVIAGKAMPFAYVEA